MSEKKYIELYVKATSNCLVGMSMTRWEQLSPEWCGERLSLVFETPDGRKKYPVVGWTDLGGGQADTVSVAKVRTIPEEEGEQATQGYLVYGGNAGVRVFDQSEAPIVGVNDHLPAGHGEHAIFVLALRDLPREVQRIVKQPLA